MIATVIEKKEDVVALNVCTHNISSDLNDIKWQNGEYVLIAGKVQVGKTKRILDICFHARAIKGCTAIILTRNMEEDVLQLRLRITEYNNKLEQSKISRQNLLQIPRSLKDFNLDELAQSIKIGGNIIVGLSNPTNLQKLKNLFEQCPELENLSILILDEYDLAPMELTDNTERTQTEDLLKSIRKYFYMMFGLTATPTPTLLNNELTKLIPVPEPLNYYGIDKLILVETNTKYNKRNGKTCKKYDADTDWYNLDCIMKDIIKKDKAGLLINTSKETLRQEKVILKIKKQYPNITYIEFNGDSIKIYYPKDHPSKSNIIVEETKHKKNRKTISNVLQDLKTDKEYNHKHILIVAGNKAGRGISFVSDDKLWHLTHLYLAVAPTGHLEWALQAVGRLCGIYIDNPTLILYCAKPIFDELLIQQKDLENIMSTAKDMPAVIKLMGRYGRPWISERKQNGCKYDSQFGKKDKKERIVRFLSSVDKEIKFVKEHGKSGKLRNSKYLTFHDDQETRCDSTSHNNKYNYCRLIIEGKKYFGRYKGRNRGVWLNGPNLGPKAKFEDAQGWWSKLLQFVLEKRPDLKDKFNTTTNSFECDIFLICEDIKLEMVGNTFIKN